ncbi:cytochrome P450 [Hypoxylon rubiginosum]|uniref:Cytochrome P450 n=1 Tax=Hypoxylon rubiginosum TaxID=110542 RepID=A0ACB9YKH9_9PEZI|nr:cytochrome P450 [Hypoxylon rubiginosum]
MLEMNAGVVFVSTVVFYRLFLHPLANFPGPKLAAATRGFEAYYDVVCKGQYTFKIAELHKKYGPIVRISPFELHVSDPKFYEAMYTREGRWDKYAWTIWRTTKHLRWYGPLMKSLPMWLMQRTADEGVKNHIGFLMVRNQFKYVDAFLSDTLAGHGSRMLRNTLYIHGWNTGPRRSPNNEKSFKRIFDEVGTITGAAFETTAHSIRLTLYHIYHNAELPYLTAVVMEGLRLSPATATRATRVAPDRDLSFRGRRIPAGTPIGMTTYLMHRDPHRWLDLQDRWKLDKFYAPLSKGPRNCLGMHLAWAELYMTVAAIVERFDLVFDSSAADDLTCTHDRFLIGTSARNGLPVTVRRVRG